MIRLSCASLNLAPAPSAVVSWPWTKASDVLLMNRLVGAGDHRAKLEAGKTSDLPRRPAARDAAPCPYSVLNEQHRTGTVQLDRDGDEAEERRQENQQQRAQRDIDQPLAEEIQLAGSVVARKRHGLGSQPVEACASGSSKGVGQGSCR